MRFIFWFVAIPFLVVAGAFAAANPQSITLRLWPFPYELVVPVYAAVLGAFLLGLFAATLWFWITGFGTRWVKRRHARRERALEEETSRLRRELAAAPRATAPPPAPGTAPAEARGAQRLIAGQRE